MAEQDKPPRNPIVVAPDLAWGQPCLEGTRFPVSVIVEFLADGLSIDDILREFPNLDREQIVEAVRWAGELLQRNARRLPAEETLGAA